MVAQASGEMTEYHEFSSMSTRSATARAKAPPEPPSPSTTVTVGTLQVRKGLDAASDSARLATLLRVFARIGSRECPPR